MFQFFKPNKPTTLSTHLSLIVIVCLLTAPNASYGADDAAGYGVEFEGYAVGYGVEFEDDETASTPEFLPQNLTMLQKEDTSRQTDFRAHEEAVQWDGETFKPLSQNVEKAMKSLNRAFPAYLEKYNARLKKAKDAGTARESLKEIDMLLAEVTDDAAYPEVFLTTGICPQQAATFSQSLTQSSTSIVNVLTVLKDELDGYIAQQARLTTETATQKDEGVTAAQEATEQAAFIQRSKEAAARGAEKTSDQSTNFKLED